MSMTSEEVQRSAALPAKPPKNAAKFTQIATLAYAAGWCVFALDESGVVWQFMIGKSEEWEALPRKRKGLPGRPASR